MLLSTATKQPKAPSLFLLVRVIPFLWLFALWPEVLPAFERVIADKPRGAVFPHILKKDSYTLNTRNIKVLTTQGRHLWMGTSMGVIRYDTTTAEDYQVYDNRNVLLSNGIFSINFDAGNRPWIGTYGGGISHFDGQDWVNFNTPHGLCDAFVYDIEFDGSTTWIATWSGINRIEGDLQDRKNWRAYTVENTDGGLIDNWVYAIELGKDGRLWAGTESGISLFDGKRWRGWNHTSGLGAPLEQVKKDNAGAMPEFQGSHHANQPPDLPNISAGTYRPNYVVSMLLDSKNRLWIGTWGGGLSLFDTKKLQFRNFTVRDGLPGNYILALTEGPDGNLWIGSNKGLTQFDGSTFTNISRLNGLNSEYVFSIAFDRDGSVWVGGHNGMDRLEIDSGTGRLKTL